MRKKVKRGGARQGSGAKPKYDEQTKTVAFRCPFSKVDELKMLVKFKLSEWSKIATNEQGFVSVAEIELPQIKPQMKPD